MQGTFMGALYEIVQSKGNLGLFLPIIQNKISVFCEDEQKGEGGGDA